MPISKAALEQAKDLEDQSVRSDDRDGKSVAHSSSEGSTSGTKEGGPSDKSSKEEISRKESLVVFRLRVLVLLVLICVAVAVSLTVYFLIRAGETEEFEAQFESAAQKVVASFEDIVVQMGAIGGLGVTYSAAARDMQTQWPFVTLSWFQQRAGNARKQSGVLAVSLAPVVTAGQIDVWEEYVNSPNNSWM